MCLAALRRQVDPRWRAFFFITDSQPFSTKLKKILASYNDSRVSFLHINRKYRIPVSHPLHCTACYVSFPDPLLCVWLCSSP